MESPLTFFIIFHKTLFARNTESFTEEERKTWFRWYAVNESIQKQIPDWLSKDCLIEEYKLPRYDPQLQKEKSYQNSCFFHLHWNPSLVTSKYIGFGQYDISMDAPPIREAISVMNIRSNVAFMMFPYHFNHLFNPYSPELWSKYFISFYNSYYQTNHSLQTVQHLPLALLHTFIIPTDFFKEMMTFIEAVHPNIWRMLGFDNRHYAGTMERVFALYINLKLIERSIEELILVRGFVNNESQHTGDEMRGIKSGSE